MATKVAPSSLPTDEEDEAQRFAVAQDSLSAMSSRTVEGQPYRMIISIVGTSPLLFHAWKNVLPDDPGTGSKGDKKRDNIED